MSARVSLSAAIIAVFALSMFVCAQASSTPRASAAGDCTADGTLDAEEKAFLLLINNHRAQNGVVPLGVSYTLSRAAQWKSQDMGANSYFAHDDLTRTWVQRIRDCGYGYNTWLGENIAAGISSAQSAFNLWRNSPGHNANMLNANYRTIGIGRAYAAGSPYGWYWTTEFGGIDDGYVTVAEPAATASTPDSPGLHLIVRARRDGGVLLRLAGRDLGGVVRVDFAFRGGVFAEDHRAPFTASWRGMDAGSPDAFSAIVYDAAGRGHHLSAVIR